MIIAPCIDYGFNGYDNQYDVRMERVEEALATCEWFRPLDIEAKTEIIDLVSNSITYIASLDHATIIRTALQNFPQYR